MPGVLIRGELVDKYSLCQEFLIRGGTSRPVQLMPGVLIRGELVHQYSLCEEF